ncbi:hypothetical protein [Ruegeria lacuscaerulensis]|uniref:hypothetical protein n=1 Tax=Ruegeria lacuscaerulensis TaxID=55218 RepID=UPI00147E37D6|nr:hypothetical protein [Ruegeria lacuscaerulensis]
MKKRLIAAIAFCTSAMAACTETTKSNEAFYVSKGWTPISDGQNGRTFYLRKAEEGGNVYWTMDAKPGFELLAKIEFDCARNRFRDLIPMHNRISGYTAPHNKDWQSVSDFPPDSVVPIIRMNVCG